MQTSREHSLSTNDPNQILVDLVSKLEKLLNKPEEKEIWTGDDIYKYLSLG